MTDTPAVTSDGYCTNTTPVPGTIRTVNASLTGRSSSACTAAAMPSARAAATSP
ncbi:hypothetical protein [Streptomyces himalayensis]|uniref:hypothetical protein n=1 Tax=Streptomyces himalayensis TaxID=2820085 RepID=UPI00215D704D|nr:hypothetical protein [Streptomyces himalayensis]